jgi:integrase
MATFRKRGQSWEVQIRRLGHASLTRSFKSKQDATVWARQVEGQLDRSDLPHRLRDAQRLTLGNLLERYRHEITPRKKSVRQERSRIDRLLQHPVASIQLSRLTPAVFARLRDERLTQVGSQAVRHDLNLLAHVIKTAKQEWDAPIADNPLLHITKPRGSKARERRVSDADLSRVAAVDRSADQNGLLPLIEFAIETAMRKSELLSLRWEHIHLERRLLNIPITKNGHARTIPLSPKALEILRLAMQQGTDRPFPMTVPWLRFAWDRLLHAAGLSDFHFHDLRHEAISRLFERGLTVPEVALISGHRDVRQLFRYTHLRAEDLVTKLG